MTVTSSLPFALDLDAPARHGFPDYPRPVLDGDYLLRYEDRWIAVTDMQAPVIAYLIDHLGTMRSINEIADAYAAAGGSTDYQAMRSLMFRVGERLSEVGLEVTYARRRTGMMVSLPADA